MRIDAMHWQQVEAYLENDDRCVVPLGCTEQHAYLSLSTDSILSERVAVEAAEPLRIPVFPVVAYGITPNFRAYPGTVSVRVATYGALLQDIVDGLTEQGFRRILFVNGHGGNIPGQAFVEEWLADSSELEAQVRWHNWWAAPETMAKVTSIDPDASHASWMENFPWTRLKGVAQPKGKKPMVDYGGLRSGGPGVVRDGLGDGSFGGLYERSDEDMRAIWAVAVAETRAKLKDWA